MAYGVTSAGFASKPLATIQAELQAAYQAVYGAGVGTTIFTLPAGYRPSAREQFAALNYTGAASALGNIDIDTSGNVIANTFTQTGAGLGNLSLSGISFDTR